MIYSECSQYRSNWLNVHNCVDKEHGVLKLPRTEFIILKTSSEDKIKNGNHICLFVNKQVSLWGKFYARVHHVIINKKL